MWSTSHLGNSLPGAQVQCSCSVLRTPRLSGFQTPKDTSRPGEDLRRLCEHGQLDSAVDLLLRMDQQGRAPSVSMYRCLLKACAKKKSLAVAKRIKGHLVDHRLEFSKVLGEDLVSILAKCGALSDALKVFWRLQERNVFCWTAVIAGYTNAGQPQEALKLYQQMEEEGVQPDAYTFVTLLKACGSVRDLDIGKSIHAEAVNCRFESDLYVGTCLVDMYGKCGSVKDARQVFDGLSSRDVAAWNVMLSAYVEQGQAETALQLYEQMQEKGVRPSNRTFVSLFQACGLVADQEQGVMLEGRCMKVISLRLGEALQTEAKKQGFGADFFVGSSLVSMYGKCGSLTDAQMVFDSCAQHDIVSWNTMLAVFVELGEAGKALQLYERMRKESLSPDTRTFVTVLQACGMLAEKEDFVMVSEQSVKAQSLTNGIKIHADASRIGLDSHVFVGNALISMYGKCGSILDAHSVFDGLLKRDLVTWNAMLAAYVNFGEAGKALDLYQRMSEVGVSPDNRTFVSALQACSMGASMEDDSTLDKPFTGVKFLEKGIAIHADARQKASDTDVFVGSALVVMYGRLGNILDAQTVFDGLSKRDVASWNAMLSAYLDQGHAEKALQLYEQMQNEGMSPDCRTFVNVLQAIGTLADIEENVMVSGNYMKTRSLKMVEKLHAHARGQDMDSDAFVGSTLVSVYGKCGSIAGAESVFNRLSQLDVVTWTAMLTAYVQHGQSDKALQLYREMQVEGVCWNEVAVMCALQACSTAGSLCIIRQIHGNLVLEGRSLSSVIASTLITAYGRCASLTEAQDVFDALPQPSVVPWNALIAAYVRQGNIMAIFERFERMQLAGVRPDGVTFLLLLSACSHVGLVEKGAEYFETMSRDYGVTPGSAHFVCMVDLLGRAGYFDVVEDLLSTMPIQPDLSTWLSVLGACRKYGKIALGKRAFDHAVRLQPGHPSAYLLMSNIYEDAGYLDHAMEVENTRQVKAAWKKPGQSWIEHMQKVHTFFLGDYNDIRHKNLYHVMTMLSLEHLSSGTHELDSRQK